MSNFAVVRFGAAVRVLAEWCGVVDCGGGVRDRVDGAASLLPLEGGRDGDRPRADADGSRGGCCCCSTWISRHPGLPVMNCRIVA